MSVALPLERFSHADNRSALRILCFPDWSPSGSSVPTDERYRSQASAHASEQSWPAVRILTSGTTRGT